MEENATIKYTIRLPKDKIRQKPSIWDRLLRLMEGPNSHFPQYTPCLEQLYNASPLIRGIHRNIENYISHQAGRKEIKIQCSTQAGGEECFLVEEVQERRLLTLLRLQTSWCNGELLAQVDLQPRFLIETLLSLHVGIQVDFE